MRDFLDSAIIKICCFLGGIGLPIGLVGIIAALRGADSLTGSLIAIGGSLLLAGVAFFIGSSR